MVSSCSEPPRSVPRANLSHHFGRNKHFWPMARMVAHVGRGSLSMPIPESVQVPPPSRSFAQSACQRSQLVMGLASRCAGMTQRDAVSWRPSVWAGGKEALP
jgi:hypothetical protein